MVYLFLASLQPHALQPHAPIWITREEDIIAARREHGYIGIANDDTVEEALNGSITVFEYTIDTPSMYKQWFNWCPPSISVITQSPCRSIQHDFTQHS